MIRSFKSKGLAELWEKGRTGKIDAKMQTRILRRLDRLDVIVRPEEMNVPGFDFHPLRGFKPSRYSVHVNGPWCITFEFQDGDAWRLDFERRQLTTQNSSVSMSTCTIPMYSGRRGSAPTTSCSRTRWT